jgi:hypothetical protein
MLMLFLICLQHNIPARTLESIESVVQRLGLTFFSQFLNYYFFVIRPLEVSLIREV